MRFNRRRDRPTHLEYHDRFERLENHCFNWFVNIQRKTNSTYRKKKKKKQQVGSHIRVRKDISISRSRRSLLRENNEKTRRTKLVMPSAFCSTLNFFFSYVCICEKGYCACIIYRLIPRCTYIYSILYIKKLSFF